MCKDISHRLSFQLLVFFPKVTLITNHIQKLITQCLRFQETRPNFLLISIIWLKYHAPEAATANILVSEIMGWLVRSECTINLLNIWPAGISASVGPPALHAPREGAQPNCPAFPCISTVMLAQKKSRTLQRCCISNQGKTQNIPSKLNRPFLGGWLCSLHANPESTQAIRKWFPTAAILHVTVHKILSKVRVDQFCLSTDLAIWLAERP